LDFENFIKSFQGHLFERFPVLDKMNPQLEVEFLISPHIIPLSNQAFKKIEESVKALFRLRSLESYQKLYSDRYPELFRRAKQDAAVLMSYDFHIDENGDPRLIEVNTNASGSVLSSCLNDFWIQTKRLSVSSVTKTADDFSEDLMLGFDQELKAMNGDKSVEIVIMDEDFEKQKMLFEFLVYKSLFEGRGYKTEICHPEDVVFDKTTKRLQFGKLKKISLIYNRFCDFLFNEARSRPLLENYQMGDTVITPHPQEYLLLADKNRMVEWGTPGFFENLGLEDSSIQAIRQVLIPSFVVQSRDSAEVWSERKEYFFKPLQSYGGKSAYRGNSVSHKVFERILAEPFLAQKLVSPAEVSAPNVDSGEMTSWKYDLRFFVYRDRIQSGIARLYQGQLTNFRTRGGGFAALKLQT
jgi:hypothetical protein